MALMQNSEELNVRERYKNIIEEKENWKSDISPFLYDCFTEIRKKISLINMGMYKSRVF